MGINCHILIAKPKGGAHKAGGLVTGVVRYAVDEPSRYKNIIISLIGKGKCSWSESRRSARGRHETVTFTGTETYTSQHISIHQGHGPAIILPIGVYEYQFTFLLPKNIPTSFEDNTCSIKYKIAIKFERPNFFSLHKKFKAEIDVFGNIDAHFPERSIEFGLQKTLFKPFSKRTHHVDVKAAISNNIFLPGQNAELTYVVTNDTEVTVPSVKAELICHTTYTSNCGRRKQSTKTIKECTIETPSVPDNAVANMANSMVIAPHLYSIQNCRIMFNDYRVKMTLRLPMPHINAFAEIPIIIGEKDRGNGVESYRENEDDPPSYFAVMKEDQEND